MPVLQGMGRKRFLLVGVKGQIESASPTPTKRDGVFCWVVVVEEDRAPWQLCLPQVGVAGHLDVVGLVLATPASVDELGSTSSQVGVAGVWMPSRALDRSHSLLFLVGVAIVVGLW